MDVKIGNNTYQIFALVPKDPVTLIYVVRLTGLSLVVNPNSLVMSTIKRSCLSYKPTYPLVISGNHHLELVSPLAMGHGFANCWPEKTVPSASATIQYHIVGYFISPLNILYIYKCIHYICIYIIYICIYILYIYMYIYILYMYNIYIYTYVYIILYI